MFKLKTAMLTLAFMACLLVGGSVADAKAGNGGGNGGGKSSDSKPASSQVEKGNQGNKVKETKSSQGQTKSSQKSNGSSKLEAKSQAKNFKDTNKHWAEVSIQKLQILGVVSGFPDGGFHPEEEVTQEQVIAMVMGALDTQEEQVPTEDITTTEETTDSTQPVEEEDTQDVTEEEELAEVPGWAKGVVGEAKEKGILNLNRFHSGVQASRVQSMVWVAKAMELEPVDTSAIPFKDGLLVTPEDMGYVMALYEEGIVKGGPGGMLNPNSSITRAQIAAIIDRVLTEQQQNEDPDTLQTIETSDGQQVLKIGTGDNATEVTLAEDVAIFVNGERVEVTDLVTGSPVRVVTNEAGEAVLIEQTVDTTQQDNTGTTETDDTTSDATETTTSEENTTNTDTTNTPS